MDENNTPTESTDVDRVSDDSLNIAANAFSASVYLREAIENLRSAAQEESRGPRYHGQLRRLKIAGAAKQGTSSGARSNAAHHIEPGAELYPAVIGKLELALAAIRPILHG